LGRVMPALGAGGGRDAGTAPCCPAAGRAVSDSPCSIFFRLRRGNMARASTAAVPAARHLVIPGPSACWAPMVCFLSEAHALPDKNILRWGRWTAADGRWQLAVGRAIGRWQSGPTNRIPAIATIPGFQNRRPSAICHLTSAIPSPYDRFNWPKSYSPWKTSVEVFRA
jgi:hypothetical protein